MRRILMHTFLLILISGCVLFGGSTAWAKADTVARPSWLGKEPIVVVGNWDAMPIYQRRRGTATTYDNEDYLKEHTDEAVKKLKEMGVTMVIIHFYKGYGLEAEAEHQVYSKKLSELCKKHGLRVGVYVGSTFFYETFLLEKPEAAEWIVPDYLGKPVVYNPTQVFRKRVYFQHPEYKAYIKRVLRIAIEDIKADLIHFDNPANQAVPAVFFHPMAIEDFKNFLRKKYTPEMLKQRLGFSNVKYVEPPKYDRKFSTYRDPLFQEWVDFRCQQLADYYGEMREFIRSLNPEVVVENNPHGLFGINTMVEQSIDFPRLLANTDIFWTEGDENYVSKDGILVSKIRTFKMGNTLDNILFTYTKDSLVQIAESIVYNRQCLGAVGYNWANFELTKEQSKYIKFYHKYFNEYYRDIDNIADVAVLHSFVTMSFDRDRPYESTFLFEQALIQAKVPFDIIFDDNLKDLSKYRVLVLADQQCLNDEKLDLVREFVKQGGGLVITEDTSLYTEWRRLRRDLGLKDIIGTKQERKSLIKKEIGTGRLVYIPQVKPAKKKPPKAAMSKEYWKLPLNFEELIESVKWAAKDDLSVEIKAPLTVTMELIEKKDKSVLLLHLINYDVKRNPLVENIEVSLKIPAGATVKQIKILSPDKDGIETIDFKETNNRVEFTVPQLRIYDLVVVENR